MKLVVVLTGWLLAACVGATQPIYRPEVVQVVDSDSDKVVEIVADERIAPHEPREVPPNVVASTLMASGQFLDEDAHSLAAPIAKHLASMQADEAVRVVGWSEDGPRYYYVLVHDGKLQVIFYAGSTRSNEYSAVIPAEAKPIVAPPTDAGPATPPTPPTETVVPAPPTDAGVVAVAPPAHRPTTTTTKPRRARSAPRPGFEPIGEAEARRRISELDQALHAGAITETEHRTKRKEVLARL